ncbi:MAG: leucine zipper domain-containing protein [Myxococcota bacterium]
MGSAESRGTKWRERYESGGLEGLKDRSRAPHTHPHAVPEGTAELIVQARMVSADICCAAGL